MNISAINAAPHNNNQRSAQISFNGCVDKSFIKLIDAATQNSIKQVVDMFNHNVEKIEPAEIRRIKSIGENTKELIKEVMNRFHPKTVLTTNGRESIIKNTATDTKLHFISFSRCSTDTGIPCDGLIDIFEPVYSMPKGVELNDMNYGMTDLSKLNYSHLEQLQSFVQKLAKIGDPQLIDGALFDLLSKKIVKKAGKLNIFDRLFVGLKAKKADKLAPEFGRSVGWVEKVKSIRAEARKQSAIKKVVTVENKKIAEQILKEQ